MVAFLAAIQLLVSRNERHNKLNWRGCFSPFFLLVVSVPFV